MSIQNETPVRTITPEQYAAIVIQREKHWYTTVDFVALMDIPQSDHHTLTGLCYAQDATIYRYCVDMNTARLTQLKRLRHKLRKGFDMDKKDIVIGGIYEFDYVKNHTALATYDVLNDFNLDLTQVKTVLIRSRGDTLYFGDRYLGAGFTMDFGAIHPTGLGRQIGYDATYSTEYQDAKQELERFLHLRGCADTLLDHMGFIYQSDASSLANRLNEYRSDYLDVQIDLLRLKLETIKATSKRVQS